MARGLAIEPVIDPENVILQNYIRIQAAMEPLTSPGYSLLPSDEQQQRMDAARSQIKVYVDELNTVVPGSIAYNVHGFWEMLALEGLINACITLLESSQSPEFHIPGVQSQLDALRHELYPPVHGNHDYAA